MKWIKLGKLKIQALDLGCQVNLGSSLAQFTETFRASISAHVNEGRNCVFLLEFF